MTKSKGLSLAQLRARYYTQIFEYKRRREIHFKELVKHRQDYRKKSARLSLKIKLWSRQIKRIDERRARLNQLTRIIVQFMNEPLTGKSTTYRHWVTKAMFYKYGLEHKISGKDLIEVTRVRDLGQPSRYRKRLNKLMSMIGSEDLNRIYNNLKTYIEDAKQGT